MFAVLSFVIFVAAAIVEALQIGKLTGSLRLKAPASDLMCPQTGDPDDIEKLGFTDDGKTWGNRCKAQLVQSRELFCGCYLTNSCAVREYSYWRGMICAIFQLVALLMAGCKFGLLHTL